MEVFSHSRLSRNRVFQGHKDFANKRERGNPSAFNLSTPKNKHRSENHFSKTKFSVSAFGSILSESRPERTAIKYSNFQKYWDGFKKR